MMTNRDWAISLFDRPVAASSATRRSVGVSSPARPGRLAPIRSISERARAHHPVEPISSKGRGRQFERAPRGGPLLEPALRPPEGEQNPGLVEAKAEFGVGIRRLAQLGPPAQSGSRATHAP